MSLERFTRGDLRTILLAVALGAVGAGVAIRYHDVAFPEASIDFKVSRPEVEQRARAFLERRGFDLKPYRQVIVFRYDDDAKTYLERELGLAEANRLMASEINVWRWKVRFFKPPQKEELVVFLDPAGAVVGFQHILEEKAAGARLEKARAQSVGEIFLYSQLGLDLAGYTLVEDSRQERPNRLDYHFTWERKNFKAKEATYRIGAVVCGDQVCEVQPFLKVPEQWRRDYQRLRSRNETLQTASNLLSIPLYIGVLFVLIPAFRQRRIVWRPLLWLTGIVGAVFTIAQINSLPLLSEGFDTATPYWQWVAGLVVSFVVAGLLLAVLLAICAGGGEVVYREAAPDKVAVPRLFTLSGLRTKEFFLSTLVGYCLAAFQLGFVVVFYLIGQRFGAWSPAEVKYQDFLSTALPWIYPLTIGLFAATFEEFVFRLFAIPFLKKYLKSTWLAVLIPAFIWGFGHSLYPQQPAWIRGVEVGLVGVVFGFVMLRFGILATLVSHYTYNAISLSLFLLRSDEPYFLVTGGLVMDAALIPLAIAGAFYWRHRRFAAEPELFNAALVAPPPPVEVAAPAPTRAPAPAALTMGAPYESLSGNRLALAAGVGLLGLALWWLLPVEQKLDSLRWQKGPREAEVIADEYLKGKGINPTEWRRVTELESHFQSDAAEYVRRRGGLRQVNELWGSRLALATQSWEVRYFRPLEKEEHRVYVAPDGRVARHNHLLEEKAPGANLSAEEAQRRAADYLARTYQLEVSGWKVAESKLEKRDARTDHRQVWEDPKAVAGEAYVRAEVEVRGDEVGNYRTYLKLPEEWLRDLRRLRIHQVVAGTGVLVLIIWVLVLGARRLAGHSFRWRLYLWLGVLLAAANLLTHLNDLRTFGAGYDTSKPWQSYVFGEVSDIVVATMGIVFLAALVVLAVDVFFAGRRFPAGFIPSQGSGYYRDALLTGLAMALFVQGWMSLYRFVDQRVLVPHPGTGFSSGQALDTYLPGLSAAIDTVLGALLAVALVAIAVGVLETVFRSMARRAVFVVLVVAVVALGGRLGVRSYVQELAFGLPIVGLFALAMRYLLRSNLVAYLITFTFGSLFSQMLVYWRHPAFQTSAVVGVLAAAALLAVVVAFLERSVRPSQAAG